MAILVNGVLAYTERVPQLDGLVARAGNDLTVVGRECNTEDIFSVADETTSTLSAVEKILPVLKNTIHNITRCGHNQLR